MATIGTYNKLSELFDAENIGETVEQDSDFTIHRLENVHPKPSKSPTFRANYYSFVLIKTGNTTYSIDDRSFPTKNNTLYFTNPGHLKSFDIKEVSFGFLITVSEQYLKEHIHTKIFDEFSFLLTEVVPPCYLDGDRFDELYHYAEQILEEQRKVSVLKHKITSSLFMVFLLKVKEYLLGDTHFILEYDRDSEIVNRFKKDLEQYFRTLFSNSKTIKEIPQVQYFAERQQLSPSYFSTVIKTKTEETPNHWIQHKMITEAKALLSGSKASVKNVAYSLGFHEATHFSKFFRKITGMTPSSYRKSL